MDMTKLPMWRESSIWLATPLEVAWSQDSMFFAVMTAFVPFESQNCIARWAFPNLCSSQDATGKLCSSHDTKCKISWRTIIGGDINRPFISSSWQADLLEGGKPR